MVERSTVTFEGFQGVQLGATKVGTGPPLVLVHGTSADRNRWNIALPRLSSRFTCYALDRRGRGTSTDADPYSLEAEAEDLRRVVATLGPAVDVVAHSFGGLVALEAAMDNPAIRRLVLYEPAAFVPGTSVYGDEILERLEWLHSIGDRERLVVTMLEEVAGIPATTVAILRKQPYWTARLDAAQTIVRELRADERYRITPEDLRTIAAPTLLLLGEASPAFYKDGTAKLREGIPNSRVHVLAGHGHGAIDTATRAFVDAVLGFLDEP